MALAPREGAWVGLRGTEELTDMVCNYVRCRSSIAGASTVVGVGETEGGKWGRVGNWSSGVREGRNSELSEEEGSVRALFIDGRGPGREGGGGSEVAMWTVLAFIGSLAHCRYGSGVARRRRSVVVATSWVWVRSGTARLEGWHGRRGSTGRGVMTAVCGHVRQQTAQSRSTNDCQEEAVGQFFVVQ